MDQRVTVTRARWAALAGEVVSRFERLWAWPELPMMERFAAVELADWLESHGFTVTRGACGLPTAFVASAGEGPAIGLLAEYDALPGLGNRALPRRARDDNAAGHACGHNLIGPANAGAAIAAREALEALGAPGRIVVLGCPAEEIVWGKLALLEGGAFDGLDALLTSHADYQTGALSRPCLAGFSAEFVFRGLSDHTGAARSHNALEAAELAVQTFERLRGHHFPDASVEHVLRVAGSMPSITPEEARLWLTVRHPDYGRAAAVYASIARIVLGAAEATETQAVEQFIAATRGYLANDVLAEAIARNMKIVGPPRWSDDDLAWMQALAGAVRGTDAFDLDRDIVIFREGCDPYCQDDGEASWHVPLGRANWAIPRQVPLHSWAMTALSGHACGQVGPLMVGEALALTAVELAASPALIAEARTEMEARRDGPAPPPPPLGARRALIEDPASFWAARWTE